MNIQGCIPRFLKKNGGWVLTVLSCIGVVVTAVLTADEAVKADEALKDEQFQKVEKAMEALKESNHILSDEEIEQISAETQLTFGEKFEIAAPIYLPAFLVALTTIGCMIGAQIFNVKQQAALVGAYALLTQQFAEYRKEVRAEVGTEREKELFLSSRKKIRELQEEIERLKEENGPQLYGIATLPNVVFEAKPEHIVNVFHHMLFNMLTCGGISLIELYDHIGLPKDTFNAEEAAKYGWCSYENEITYGCSAVEFEIVDVKREDGKTVHIINFDIPPYELGLDYGMSDSSTDYIYEGYDCERAMFLAQASVDADVERFEQPKLWIQHSW